MKSETIKIAVMTSFLLLLLSSSGVTPYTTNPETINSLLTEMPSVERWSFADLPEGATVENEEIKKEWV